MRLLAARIACVLAATAACAGCASVPAAPDRAGVSRAIADRAGVDAGGLTGPREWTAPPGLSLADGVTMDEAVAAALWNNADFHAALASLGLARADLIEAGLIRNPIFSLLFPAGPKQLEWTLTWPVDVLWQRPKRIADARLNAEATAGALVAHGLRLVADVKLAFLDVLASDRRLALGTEQAKVAGELAGLAAGRLRAGDISDFEVRLAQTDAARLEAARLTRQATRDFATLRLRTLLGLGPDGAALTLVEPPATAPAECGPLPDLVKTSLAARPDVRAAELQIEAAGARAGLERARIVTLTATLDANAQGREGFEMGPGLAVELPILSQNQGRRARAAAELEQASRRYLAVRAAVSAEVAAGVIALTEASRRRARSATTSARHSERRGSRLTVCTGRAKSRCSRCSKCASVSSTRK